MPKYIVWVQEVHVVPAHVEADSPTSAVKKVNGGFINKDYDALEYSHDLGPELWDVEVDPDEDAIEAKHWGPGELSIEEDKK